MLITHIVIAMRWGCIFILATLSNKTLTSTLNLKILNIEYTEFSKEDEPKARYLEAKRQG